MAINSGSDFTDALNRAKLGHGDGFEALYRRFNRPVASFAAARRAIDPEGIVNEVFVRVFRKLPEFSGTETQFSAWIFQIARNLVIDEVRRQSRRIDEVTGETFDVVADRSANVTYDDPEGSLLDDESDALVAYLEHLTPEQRDVILLRIVADQSIEVVAATLGKSVPAVKSIQYRATQRLRHALEKKSNIGATSARQTTF